MSPTTGSGDGKDALKRLVAVDLTKCETHLALASTTEDDIPELRRVLITGDVADQFTEIATRTIDVLRSASDGDDLTVREYEPLALLRKYEIEYLNLDQNEHVARQITTLCKRQFQLEAFDQDDTFVGKLRFYAIVLKPQSPPPVICFRSYTRKKELSRSPFFAITMRNGIYDSVSEGTLLFDKHVDCIAIGSDMLILNKDKFQKIFQYYEELAKSAKKVLGVIKKHIPIDDFEAFSSACQGHLQKLAKLKNIAGKPYLQHLRMSDIKKVIGKYNLSITTVGKGGNEKLHYDSSDKWGILRLLDDDYLESLMTGSSYEANSKRPI